MKHKIYLILLIAVIFISSCAPKTEGEIPGTEKEQEERDDLGCFYSCKYFPEGNPRQMCEDWKAGKQVFWPDDCSQMQYGPCVKLCEAEKKGTVSGGEQKQAFNVLPPLITAEFASDVTEEDKKFVITGISATDFYLQKWFGKSINQPAGLRVSVGGKSTNRENDAQVVVEDGKIVILIETGSTVWKEMTQINAYGGENRNRISAHEYVHVYQFQNGCGRPDIQTPIAPKWFLEGGAEWLSHKVMHEAGLVPSSGFPEYSIIPLAKQQVGLLKSFEKKEGLETSLYSFYTMAVDFLMKNRQMKTLDDFCVNLAGGNGMSMPEAFEAAFGITLDKFYEDFESYRKTWSSKFSSDQNQGFPTNSGTDGFYDPSTNGQKETGIPKEDPEAESVYIYVTDFRHGRLIRIDDMTGKGWVEFGTVGSGVNQFNEINQVASDKQGRIYITDQANHRIVRIDDMTGKGWVSYGTHYEPKVQGGDRTGKFHSPFGLDIDSKDRIYVVDQGSARVVRIDDVTGKGWTTIGKVGSGVGEFRGPKYLEVDDQDRIYVGDKCNYQIVRFNDMTGAGWTTFQSSGTNAAINCDSGALNKGGNGTGQFEHEIGGIAIDSQNRIYVADEHNDRIFRIDDLTGKNWAEFSGIGENKLWFPHDIAVSKSGKIYIADTRNNRIVRIEDFTGKGWIAFGPYGNSPSGTHAWQLEAPKGIFVAEKS